MSRSHRRLWALAALVALAASVLSACFSTRHKRAEGDAERDVGAIADDERPAVQTDGGRTMTAEPVGTGSAGAGGDQAVEPPDLVTPGDDPPQEDPTSPNPDCPQHPPFMGPGAPMGECCYRTQASAEPLDGDPVVATFRVNYERVINHPDSLGMPALVDVAVSRNDHHEVSLLLQLEMPVRDGLPQTGAAVLTHGYGAYDCQGRYRFFADSAAPRLPDAFPGSEDRGRYAPHRRRMQVTARDRRIVTLAPEERTGRKTYMPFQNADTFALEWELITQDLSLFDVVFEDGSLRCSGRRDGEQWIPGARSHSYVGVADNHQPGNAIPSLGFETFSQVLGFGLLTLGDPTDVDSRCEPQLDLPIEERTCPWIKLPDSLCPESDDERARFDCHVGYADNADHRPVRCNMTPADDGGEVQCCDPLGRDGLPACNAWLLESELVVATADVSGSAATLQSKCSP